MELRVFFASSSNVADCGDRIYIVHIHLIGSFCIASFQMVTIRFVILDVRHLRL